MDDDNSSNNRNNNNNDNNNNNKKLRMGSTEFCNAEQDQYFILF
jgi:hypothetical protein